MYDMNKKTADTGEIETVIGAYHYSGERPQFHVFTLQVTFLARVRRDVNAQNTNSRPEPDHHRNIIKHHSPLPLPQRPVTKTRLLHQKKTLPHTSCLPIWMKISTVSLLAIAQIPAKDRRKEGKKDLLTFPPNSGSQPPRHRGADCRR